MGVWGCDKLIDGPIRFDLLAVASDEVDNTPIRRAKVVLVEMSGGWDNPTFLHIDSAETDTFGNFDFHFLAEQDLHYFVNIYPQSSSYLSNVNITERTTGISYPTGQRINLFNTKNARDSFDIRRSATMEIQLKNMRPPEASKDCRIKTGWYGNGSMPIYTFDYLNRDTIIFLQVYAPTFQLKFGYKRDGVFTERSFSGLKVVEWDTTSFLIEY